MSRTEILGRLLGLDGAQHIDDYGVSLAAPWAQQSPAWLLFACAALVVVAVVFYARFQRTRRFRSRLLLTLLRAGSLSLLVLILAEPILTVTVTSRRRPVLWVLFDGTESMAIVDDLPSTEREALAAAVGIEAASANPGGASGNPHPHAADFSRAGLVRALLRNEDSPLKSLAEKYRMRAFLLEGAEGVRLLELGNNGSDEYDGTHLAAQLATDGQVTALGGALNDLARRHATANLAGLIVFSDFDQNAGPAAPEAARQLGVPIFAVGVGPTVAADAAVAVQAPPHTKRGERATVTVHLKQQGLEGLTARVQLSTVAVGPASDEDAWRTVVGEQSVVFEGPAADVEFSYLPEDAGRFRLVAEVDPLPGETVVENNLAEREITVRDDFLRLLFVEYEPTWEWRFVKEVFHRDSLVGMEGFRTFLGSSDPRVRQANPMFLEAMSPSRSEFFSYDVIVVGDVPSAALSPRFCEMVDEFVRNFGGGLVVLAGPRFGLAQLAETPLANLLPVKIDSAAPLADREPFRLQLSPRAFTYDFMQLGAEEVEHVQAWDNLGPLPWYQPVERVHTQATVLAHHPSDRLPDGSPQPLIAVRRAGRGEVVYLGFNETWRLRKGYGEHYYRQFWGQMIHRLGFSHQLGSQKRFVVGTDRRDYWPDEDVLLSVEAYDEQFQPLLQDDLPGRRLRAELVPPPSAASGADEVQPLDVTEVRGGLFETRFRAAAPGRYWVRVTDPFTELPVETMFDVADRSVERRSVVRNVDLQQAIAGANPGGRSYELTEAARLTDEIRLVPRIETTIEPLPLWNTWAALVLFVSLLLGEWFFRKWVNLL